MTAADVAALLEHLRSEVPGQLVIRWDGAPIHRHRVIQEVRAYGAADSTMSCNECCENRA